MRRVRERGIEVELTDAARALLGDLGYDPTYGARPLKRVIQKHLVDRLALAILEGDVPRGRHGAVDAVDGELSWLRPRPGGAGCPRGAPPTGGTRSGRPNAIVACEEYYGRGRQRPRRTCWTTTCRSCRRLTTGSGAGRGRTCPGAPSRTRCRVHGERRTRAGGFDPTFRMFVLEPSRRRRPQRVVDL